MRKLLLFTFACLALSVNAAHAQTYFQFGVVTFGTSTTTATRGFGTLGAVSTADPTFTTGQWHPLSLTTTGRLRVDTGSSGSGTSMLDGGTFTINTSNITPAGFIFDDTSPTACVENDGCVARMTANRAVHVNLRKADGTEIAESDGGTGASSAATSRVVNAYVTPLTFLDVDETEETVKATAGELCTVWVTNRAATTRWLKFYNATIATVVVGTTAPLVTIGIAGNASDNVTGSFATNGGCLNFGTAISIAATTDFANTDTGAPGANDLIVVVGYR
jgi:hypothetical protein